MFKLLCVLIFKIQGWKFISKIPADLRSFVFVGAPHTSNADIIPTMAMAYFMKRNTKFVIKNQWLKAPLGIFLRSVGAIGVDKNFIQKNGSKNTTELMACLFKEHKDLVLMISPEGTRSPNSNWKSGFYYIAQKANVPIVLGYADYEKKEAGLGEVIYLSNFEEDMQKITNFYRNIKGKNPQNFKLDSKFQEG
jgi:1-acyl-sn-glycerol-3-phosphate acyltransferase